MGKNIHSHTEWCIVRFAKGKFERAREGYKSAANARRGIPSAAREYLAEGGDRNATYSIGRYLVGDVIVDGAFLRVCA